MMWRREALILFAALLQAGCPRGTGKTGGDESGVPLPPAVPAKLEAQSVPPETGHDPSAKSKLIGLMAEENARWFRVLQNARPAPAHFIGYTVHERRSVTIEAEAGVMLSDDDETHRVLDVEVRVGSKELDSRHGLRDPRLAAFTSLARLGSIPFGEDPKAIKHHLWLETDRRYREGVLLLGMVLTEQQVAGREKEKRKKSADFVSAEPRVFYQKKAPLQYDRKSWVARIRDCSRRAADPKGVATRSNCRADFELNTVYYVNSEGSQLQTSWTNSRFMVQVGVKADDGMPLSRLEQAFAPTPAELPSDAKIDEMIKVVNRDLKALHKAPLADPFVGPAILEGRASAVFVHEVFGHRIEGHRQEDDVEGQTFTKQVGNEIMPDWLSVYDDPTIQRLNGTALNGFYRYDDEGVAAARASLVENGVFRGFVMGRNPIPGFDASNGHGRREPGNVPVARQGNLVVETKRSVTKKELLAALIAEVKRQRKPYGMIFTDISGGFTNTTRIMAQTFKVEPVMAYRVYPDGRQEVVRGIDISGSPLTALASIVSTARPVETFNGICGAESGWVPVSASAPSLLLRSLEVERSFSPNDSGPVLPPPAVKGGAR
ncbi:MAG TPA: metallopeptidase TldD-related protein [Kofleriaceae bacterium]|nr:metallopeptidase TldD-related protein [Kofleriaceae bacterium]